MAALLHARCVEAARQFGEAASHGNELAKKETGVSRWQRYVERGEGRQRGNGGVREDPKKPGGTPNGGTDGQWARENHGGGGLPSSGEAGG